MIQTENKISFEEHEVIGMIAKILNVKLIGGLTDIHNHYKTKAEGSRKAMHWEKANKHLSEFKNHMEEIMFYHYPKESETGIYYGSRKELDIIKWLKNHLLKEYEEKLLKNIETELENSQSQNPERSVQ